MINFHKNNFKYHYHICYQYINCQSCVIPFKSVLWNTHFWIQYYHYNFIYCVLYIYMWGHCGLIKFTCMITFEATCLKTRSILKPNHGRTTICYKWGLTSVHTWYHCACLYFNLIRHCSFNPGQLFSLRVKKNESVASWMQPARVLFLIFWSVSNF